MADILTIRDLHTHFYLDEGTVYAVNGVSLRIPKGKTIGIVGESGCGKSVTAYSILRLVSSPGRIVSGEIILHGRNGSPFQPLHPGRLESPPSFHRRYDDDVRLLSNHLLQTNPGIRDRLILCHVAATGQLDEVMEKGVLVNGHNWSKIYLQKDQRLSLGFCVIYDVLNPLRQLRG